MKAGIGRRSRRRDPCRRRAGSRYRALVVSGVALLVGLGGCGGEDMIGPDAITRDDVTDAFTAESLTATTGGVTTDLLAAGATLAITLDDAGTTTGRLFVPGGNDDGSDLDVSLDGTFDFDDATNEVTFTQDADTFFRDLTFQAVRLNGAVRLQGNDTFGGTAIFVVLRTAG